MNLLASEAPIQINRTIATAVGIYEAVVLGGMDFFGGNATIQELVPRFPFWSSNSVRRVVRRLEKLNLLVRKPTLGKTMDRTIYFTINHDAVNAIIEKANKTVEVNK